MLEGQPAAAGDLVCERMRAMRSDLALRRAALLSSVGAQPRSTYFRLLQLDEYLGGLVEDFVIGLAGLRDRSFADLLDEGLAPAPVTAATLNATFAAAPNGQLSLPLRGRLDRRRSRHAGAAAHRRRQRMRRCAARGRESLDPARFAALDNALVLARLALLDQAGVRRLAGRFGGRSRRAAPRRPAALFGVAG